MIAAVVAAWLGFALLLTVVMARRGHGSFQVALLGTVLGPVAVPLAIAHRERLVLPPTGAAASSAPGRVLVPVLCVPGHALRKGGRSQRDDAVAGRL